MFSTIQRKQKTIIKEKQLRPADKNAFLATSQFDDVKPAPWNLIPVAITLESSKE
jgi:hypothetical protein